MVYTTFSPDSVHIDKEKTEINNKNDANKGPCGNLAKTIKRQDLFEFCKVNTVAFSNYRENDARSANNSPGKPKVIVDQISECKLKKRSRDNCPPSILNKLMQYRNVPASPSPLSVATSLYQENCGSHDTSNSLTPKEPQEMNCKKFHNEIFDELNADKKRAELDFAEFLIETNFADPQHYMTPETLHTSGYPMPTNQLKTNSTLSTSTDRNVEHAGSRARNINCGLPSFSIASSTNVNSVISSSSSSPVSKRFHLSNSGPPSPRLLNHMRNHIFKVPHSMSSQYRPVPVSQCAMSLRSNQINQSDHSDHSNQSSLNNSKTLASQRCFSPRSNGDGAPSPQLPDNISESSGYNKSMLQYGQYPRLDHSIQNTPTTEWYQGEWKTDANVQNIPVAQSKFVSPTVGHSHEIMADYQQSCAMNNIGNLRTVNFQGQFQTANSHFDQGYFASSDHMSNYNFKSGAFMEQSNLSNSLNSQHKLSGANLYKSAPFTDNTSVSYACHNGNLSYGPCYGTNVPDCKLAEYRNSIEKMHSTKMTSLNDPVDPETSPYIVPIINGQTTMNPFEYSNPNNIQPLSCHHKSSSNGFETCNNKNLVMQKYSENMHAQSAMSNLNYQVQQSSCNEPMGPMHQPQMDPYERGQSASQLQNAKGQEMYDSINVCNNVMKNNCHFAGQSLDNVNNKSNGKMKLNSGVIASECHMPSSQQAEMNVNYINGQNLQHSQNLLEYWSHTPVHMNMSSASNSNGMMGCDHQFEQNHGMPRNINIVNINDGMCPQNQGPNTNWNRPTSQVQQANQMGAVTHSNSSCTPGHGKGSEQGQCGQLSGGACTIPNCTNCNNMASPPIMSPQQPVIQHLMLDISNTLRSHPLFSLLKELIIADMNLNMPNFPYQLILNLPADFDKLLQNFMHKNQPAGNYQMNSEVDSVVMDALKFAYQCFIEKLRQKQEQQVYKQSESSLKMRAVEEYCNKFDQSVKKSCYIQSATLQVGDRIDPGHLGSLPNSAGMGSIGLPETSAPPTGHKISMNMSNVMMHGGTSVSPQPKKESEFGRMMSSGFTGVREYDLNSDCGSIVSSSSHPNKPESKRHPTLPKESVMVMLDWLRENKGNPYPSDDEKAMLIKQTGLSINQLNYWFTNARRRIIPKWEKQCKT